jgi:hypothetical protein
VATAWSWALTSIQCSYQDVFSEISSSQGGEYEAHSLLGCTAMFLIGCRWMSIIADDGGSTNLWNVGLTICDISDSHSNKYKDDSLMAYLKSHLVNLYGETTLHCVWRSKALKDSSPRWQRQ